MSWKNILRKGEAGDLQEQYGMRSDKLVDYFTSGDDKEEEETVIQEFGRNVFDMGRDEAYETLREILEGINKEWYSGLNPNSTDEQIKNKAKQVLLTDNKRKDGGSYYQWTYAKYFENGGKFDEMAMREVAGKVRENLHKKLDPDFLNYINENNNMKSMVNYQSPYESLRIGEIFDYEGQYGLPKNLKELYQMYKKETGKTPKVQIKIPMGKSWWY